LLLSARTSLEEEKSFLQIAMRLLKDEEIKFSANKFLLNKWFFVKTNKLINILGLDFFVIK